MVDGGRHTGGPGGWQRAGKTSKCVLTRSSCVCKDAEDGKGCGVSQECCKAPCGRVGGAAMEIKPAWEEPGMLC